MNIDWTRQPGPEFKALEYKRVIYWVIETGTGYMDGDVFFTGEHCTIHHKPEPAVYMPEVGEWCEYLDCNDNWNKCFYVGVDDTGKNVFSTKGDIWSDGDKSGFRPIKTEREQFVEQAKAIFKGENRSAHTVVAGVLYDNGARFK